MCAEPRTFGLLYVIFLLSLCTVSKALEDDAPAELRYIRVYGGTNELAPPVYILPGGDRNIITRIGSEFVTIELDVLSVNAPAMYAILVHCNSDWIEDNNAFLNDPTKTRTSNFAWNPASTSSRYFTFRGTLNLPDAQTKIRFGGNWKVKIFDYDNASDKPFAEARFFAVEPKAYADIQLFPDVYQPIAGITPSANTIDIVVQGSNRLFDLMQNTAVLYKNHRWSDPITITEYEDEDISKRFKYKFVKSVTGTISIIKRYRAEKIPTENEYRVFDLNNVSLYPNPTHIARQQFMDLPRNGGFNFPDNDGALFARYVSPAYDEYLPVEFVFDPEFRGKANRDVFVSGSFNNWNPDRNWIMSYDSEKRLYKLRAMLRRGMHDYLYATGDLNSDTGEVENLDYTEYEGNSTVSNNSYIGIVYYKEQNFAGYDTIIAVAATNSF